MQDSTIFHFLRLVSSLFCILLMILVLQSSSILIVDFRAAPLNFYHQTKVILKRLIQYFTCQEFLTVPSPQYEDFCNGSVESGDQRKERASQLLREALQEMEQNKEIIHLNCGREVAPESPTATP